MQPAAGATRQPREYVPDRAESDVDDPDLGAAAMEADAEGGGGGAEGDFRPSATFADWPDDDAEGEDAPRHQLRIGPSSAGSSAGLAGQGGAKRRHAGPSAPGGKLKKLKGAAAATRREEAAAKANHFRREVRRPPLVSA